MTPANEAGTPPLPPPAPMPVTLGSVAVRFPNAAIVSNPKLERWIINWVWVTVPLQYFILTRFPGGMRSNQWLAIVVSVTACMLLVLLVSYVMALIFPMKMERNNWEIRLRTWSVALVTHWTATVTLLAASYLVAYAFGLTDDLVQIAVCACKKLNCNDHPRLLLPSSFVIFFIYSFAAVFLVFAVLKLSRCAVTRTTFPAPHTIAVIVICAVLLNLLYGASKLI
ncbi:MULTISPECIES: hypothetical protein [unclassified Bradyrhizobium]|uniref:hypothetical protein n=1 Tax=unclassified Bradyrhizobium TaxID=2631580 RepID=UPI0028E67935|nr:MULTISPECIES: hypothetical protein [unclassified Bradyrhizobium]